MHHQLMYSAANLAIEYDLVDDFMRARWAREQTVETIQAGYAQILVELKAVYCHRLLDDQRLINGLWAELADWVALDWYPRAQQAGLSSHAVIYATEFFERRSIELALARVAGGLIAGFETEEEACRALLAI